MNPVFSILIPAYNVAKYIEDCIESIKNKPLVILNVS